MTHSSNISWLPPPASTWYSSWTFLTLKMARLRCLQTSGEDNPFMQCRDTEERHPSLEQPQNWQVIFIFSSHLLQHSLTNEYYSQLPRMYWQFWISWTRANKQQCAKSPLVSPSCTTTPSRWWGCYQHQLLYVLTVLTFRNSTFCRQCVYMLNTYLRTNSELFPIHHSMAGFYNWECKCSGGGTNCVFNKTNFTFRP